MCYASQPRLITAPDFELPPYNGLPLKVPPDEISELEVDASIERLRGRMADFGDIEGRTLQMDDFCVIDFARTPRRPAPRRVAAAGSQGTRRQGKFLDQTHPGDVGPRFQRSPARRGGGRNS